MTTAQDEIIAFLSSPATYGRPGDKVEKAETHGAIVFLCGSQAVKLKRGVVYDYMDFGTPEKRRAMLQRELTLNRPAAPSIYRDVVPIVRNAQGSLAIGGPGTPVDWVLRMNRFRTEDELVSIAARGALDDTLAMQLGRSIAVYHKAAARHVGPAAGRIADILDELDRVFAGLTGAAAARHHTWSPEARHALDRGRLRLDRRGRAGFVRRCHGDLHLGNLVLVDGVPVPFDALEFDEVLGTCDVLYDLGFLIMDLCHRNLRRAACRVLDAWLAEFDGAQDDGLATLPLFLSVRAVIRAMVLMQSDVTRGRPGASEAEAEILMQQAEWFLSRQPPVCVAIGGYSGSGKSRLARALAPEVGSAPGAVWLSSDILRKAHGTGRDSLPEAAYTPEARSAIYQKLFGRARSVLRSGHSAILDATFLSAEDRLAAQGLAEGIGVPFAGFWLDAPEAELFSRIRNRHDDPSDADAAVLSRQLAAGAGDVGWNQLDATVPVEGMAKSALATLCAIS